MPRLSAALGGGPRLLVKRDDAIAFGFGGNKVRKLAFVAAHAGEQGADTLITAGGVQSNHARATAAVAAKLGMRAMLVANGGPQPQPTANALLDALLGADVVYVGAREERNPKMEEIAATLRNSGRHPYVIPIGASIPLGALGFVHALAELVEQIDPPDFIFHATSSGGTQAGLIAGCRLLDLPTRVIGVSADDTAGSLSTQIAEIVRGVFELLRVEQKDFAVEVDDTFVGQGYGIPTAASREAIELAARSEAIFLDPTYTSKAMAGLIAYVRDQKFTPDQTVLFWHTGGQVSLFA
jgi:1-aminocyclopropane-1-carboxylate deaminase/D-cysteine desulfhydrase-like pyridoxal-dependent ACC family enzyme